MKTKSMTGFGRAADTVQDIQIEVEVRSVNHRFLDVSCKLPSAYAGFERDIVQVAREQLRRGRLDVTVVRTAPREIEGAVVFNEALFDSYWNAVQTGLVRAGVTNKIARALGVANVISRREVIELASEQPDVELEKETLLAVVRKGLSSLVEMRVHEGAELAADLTAHIDAIEEMIGTLEGLVDTTVSSFQERLEQRIERLQPDVAFDKERMAQEIAYLADRTDVSEELVRLRAHVGQFRSLLQEEGTGRKAEFLIQEMGREINTCGSKSQSGPIASIVVDMKASLEKMREQIQNVE